MVEKGIARPKLHSICINVRQQEDRDTRPVSINRRGQCTSFTTFDLPLLEEKGIACPKLTFYL